VWSLFAALGLFVAGAAVSVTHGVQELVHPEPASDFAVGYAVLAFSFVFEGISFRQSVRQARPEAESMHRDLIEHVLVTSDPTLRAVFAEDSAALIGLVIAAAALGAHQLNGSPVPDAAGSILIGVLLAVVAIILINRNRRFLVGQEADPPSAHSRHPSPAGCAGGGPSDLSAAGDCGAADGLGSRRRGSHWR
jgi:divalent metal cation (Fe/Co/Zn/Cd) transporter